MNKKSRLENFLYSRENVYKVTRFVFMLVSFYLLVALVAFVYGFVRIIEHGTTFGAILSLLASSIPTLIVVFAVYGILIVGVLIYEKMTESISMHYRRCIHVAMSKV